MPPDFVEEQTYVERHTASKLLWDYIHAHTTAAARSRAWWLIALHRSEAEWAAFWALPVCPQCGFRHHDQDLVPHGLAVAACAALACTDGACSATKDDWRDEVLLEELGNYLQAEGLGILGTTLFLGGLPVDAPNITTVDAITALVETPGFPADYVHDVVGPSREAPWCKSLPVAPRTTMPAPAWAQDIFVALGRIRNQALSGT